MTVLFTIELRVACDTANKYVLAKHAVQQAVLQAYARAALLDDTAEIAVYSHSYEYGRLDIPLGALAAKENVEIAAMSARLAEALRPGTSGTRRPVLRVIEGGRPAASNPKS